MFKSNLNVAKDTGSSSPTKGLFSSLPDTTGGDASKETTGIWSSLLKSAGSANVVPSATLLLLGGTPKSQKLFIQRIQQASLVRANPNKISQAETPRFPSIANSFALGYTYIEFKDQDHDEMLSHLDIYTLPSQEKATFLPLLQDFMSRKVTRVSSKPLLVTILLDWEDPLKHWARDIASWLVLLKESLKSAEKSALDINEEKIRHRLQTYVTPEKEPDAKVQYSSVVLPLEDGEYDLPLGIDLAVAVSGSERILYQDTKNSISDDTIDFVQQFLRTVALKHGFSVLYTPKSLEFPNTNFVSLISERLELPIGLNTNQRGVERLVPSVVNVDQVAIPAGWDSRGKILTLRDGFNVELVSKYWVDDIKEKRIVSVPSDSPAGEVFEDEAVEMNKITKPVKIAGRRHSESLKSAVKYYESEIIHLHPHGEAESSDDLVQPDKHAHRKPREQKTNFQEFMGRQYEVLESKIRQEEESMIGSQQGNPAGTPAFRRNKGGFGGGADSVVSTPAVSLNEHYNIGGIQVEGADEVYRRLKVQEAINNSQPTVSPSLSDSSTPNASPFTSDTSTSGPIGGRAGLAGIGLRNGAGTSSSSAYLDSPTTLRQQTGTGLQSASSGLGYAPLGRPKGVVSEDAASTLSSSFSSRLRLGDEAGSARQAYGNGVLGDDDDIVSTPSRPTRFTEK